MGFPDTRWPEQDYVCCRTEIGALGKFLNQMLGDRWLEGKMERLQPGFQWQAGRAHSAQECPLVAPV